MVHRLELQLIGRGMLTMNIVEMGCHLSTTSRQSLVEVMNALENMTEGR